MVFIIAFALLCDRLLLHWYDYAINPMILLLKIIDHYPLMMKLEDSYLQ